MGQRVVRSGLFLLGPGVQRGGILYLCCVIIRKFLRHANREVDSSFTCVEADVNLVFSIQHYFISNSKISSQENAFENVACKLAAIVSAYAMLRRNEPTDFATQIVELAMFTPEEADDNESANQGTHLKREDVILPRKLNQQFDPIESNWFRAIRFTLVGQESNSNRIWRNKSNFIANSIKYNLMFSETSAWPV